jgi:DUF4097 and DUF4098 domain-containing protein YvlB
MKTFGLLLRLSLALALASTLATGCKRSFHFSVNDDNGNEVRETSQKAFKAAKVMTLRVRAANGDVKVSARKDGKDEIEIVATKILRGKPSSADLKKSLSLLKATATLENDTLKVQANWEKKRPSGVQGYVKYEITIPSRLAADIETENGDISTMGLAGNAKLKTENGDVSVQNMTGALEIVTENGSVHAKASQSTQTVKIQTTNGSIHAESMDAESLVIKTENGEVNWRGSASSLSLETRNGEANLEPLFAQPTKSFEIKTDLGDVRVKLPQNPSVHVVAETGNGSLSVEGESSKIADDHRLECQFGKGEARLHIQTNQGDIAISP